MLVTKRFYLSYQLCPRHQRGDGLRASTTAHCVLQSCWGAEGLNPWLGALTQHRPRAPKPQHAHPSAVSSWCPTGLRFRKSCRCGSLKREKSASWHCNIDCRPSCPLSRNPFRGSTQVTNFSLRKGGKTVHIVSNAVSKHI